MRSPVFLDTAGLVSLAMKRDRHHAKAVELRRGLSKAGVQIVTSQWVLTEFLGWASDLPMRHLAVSMTTRVLTSPRVTVVPASDDHWHSALRLYADRSDKEWSHVDCSTILLCRGQGINDVFSSDHHFTQAGLSILLPS